MPRRAENFVQWWRQCEPDLLRRIARSGLRASDAEELLQDAALYVWARHEELNSQEDVRRLAFFKVRYLLLDSYRRKQLAFQPAGDAGAIAEPPMAELIDYQQAWERLPKEQRDVVSLLLSGRDYSWIARQRGISEATVRSLWRFAKHKLSQEE